jgi:hypothetical protein
MNKSKNQSTAVNYPSEPFSPIISRNEIVIKPFVGQKISKNKFFN